MLFSIGSPFNVQFAKGSEISSAFSLIQESKYKLDFDKIQNLEVKIVPQLYILPWPTDPIFQQKILSLR